MQTLSENEIENNISSIDQEWELINLPYLKKDFEFENFKEALDFVNSIAEIAESVNHHPDISVSYNKVSLKIYTHDTNSITDLDFKLVQKIDELSSDNNQELLDAIELLKNGSDFERRKAAARLGKIGNDLAIGPLIKSLKDDDRFVQKAAARSLGKIGDKRAIVPLNIFLGHTDLEFRWSAKEALIMLIERGIAAEDDLIDALESRNYHKREMALEAMEAIGGDNSGEYIKKALFDDESQVRWRAARAISKCYDEDSVKILKKLSKKDPDHKVNEEAVKSLNRIKKMVQKLYEDFEKRLKFINEEIQIRNVKEGKSYYSFKRQFSGVSFNNPHKLRFVVYQGKKQIKWAKTAKDPKWGVIYLQKDEDLGRVLEAVKQSYIIAQKDFS